MNDADAFSFTLFVQFYLLTQAQWSCMKTLQYAQSKKTAEKFNLGAVQLVGVCPTFTPYHECGAG